MLFAKHFNSINFQTAFIMKRVPVVPVQWWLVVEGFMLVLLFFRETIDIMFPIDCKFHAND